MNYKNYIKRRIQADKEIHLQLNILDHIELRHWLKELPLLEPKSTVTRLSRALNAFNQNSTDPQTRSKNLQEYRNIVLLLNPSLNLDSLKRLSFKEDDRETLLAQTSTLYLTLADGYKILLDTILEKQPERVNNSILLPLFYAIEALSLTALHCFRSYKSTPPDLFRDIHLLYQLSDHLQLLDKEVDTGNMSLAATTIKNLYKQVMYLSCLDPYRLPVGIAEKLYERLSRLSQFLQLSNHHATATPENAFIVDLTQDDSPQFICQTDHYELSASTLVFDPSNITININQEITLLKMEGDQPAIHNEIELLQQLNINPRIKLPRQTARTQITRPCRLTFGIDAINHFLTLAKNEFASILESNADNFGQHVLESWKLVNQSDEGLCLMHDKTSRHDVRVGEILGLLSEESIEGKKNGRIAIICWIRSDRNNHTHIGIQTMPGNLLPAVCRLIDGPNVNNTFPAIFISSNAENKCPATLLTSKKVYQKNRIIETTIGEQPMRIKAGDSHNSTFSFDRFDFTSLKSL